MIVVSTLLNSCVVVLDQFAQRGEPLARRSSLFDELQLSFDRNVLIRHLVYSRPVSGRFSYFRPVSGRRLQSGRSAKSAKGRQVIHFTPLRQSLSCREETS